MHLQPNRNQNQIRKASGERAKIAGGGSGPSGAVIIIVSLAFWLSARGWVSYIWAKRPSISIQLERERWEVWGRLLGPFFPHIFPFIFSFFFGEAGKTHHHHNVPSISGNSVCCGPIPRLQDVKEGYIKYEDTHKDKGAPSATKVRI